MTWELLYLISLMCMQSPYSAQLACQQAFIDCIYSNIAADITGVEPKHLRKCIEQRRAPALKETK